MIKIALIQQVCAHYRIPVFRRLAKDVGLILYYGEGQRTGANQNAKIITGFKTKRLFSISFGF